MTTEHAAYIEIPPTPAQRARAREILDAHYGNWRLRSVAEKMLRRDRRRVYFIQCWDDGPIKIGIAADVASRLSTLQSACPFPLKVIVNVRGGRLLEEALHKRFAEIRVRGEWFRPTLELLTLARSLGAP